MPDTFETDPRDYALELEEQGVVEASTLLIACLKHMSYDQVQKMLIDNELSPRFLGGNRVR